MSRPRFIRLNLFLAAALALGALPSAAQLNQPVPKPGEEPVVEAPMVSFSFLLENSDPETFTISVTSMGTATYESRGAATAGDLRRIPHDHYTARFTMSEQTRDRIFRLAEQARYFEGNFQYRGKVGNMGEKVLAFTSPNRRHETTYVYSDHPAIQELTEIFHNISNTMQAGRKLAYLHRHDRLGLDAELKRLEAQVKSRRILELHAIAPALRQLSEDTAVMRMARQRARDLLRQTGAHEGSPSPEIGTNGEKSN